MIEGLYWRFAGGLEDFWGRRSNAPLFTRAFRVFGWPVELSANDGTVLAAADFSASLYSQAPPLDESPFRIQVVVRGEVTENAAASDRPPGHIADGEPPPVRYTGSGDWAYMDLGEAGQVFADFKRGEAAAVLSPALAARPDLVSRSILNTLLNNFLTRHGFAMLHATGLVRGEQVLMLMAPHNTGKSTTALRLARSGRFRLLSDSQVYVRRIGDRIQLTGFPAGRGKLRADMLPEFPDLRDLLSPEQVRDETKFVVDLRRLDPGTVCEEAVYPQAVDWCLLSRTDRPRTAIRPATEEEVWEAIMLNSLHYDREEVWAENLGEIEALVKMARFWHLELGRNGEDIVEVIRSWAS